MKKSLDTITDFLEEIQVVRNFPPETFHEGIARVEKSYKRDLLGLVEDIYLTHLTTPASYPQQDITFIKEIKRFRIASSLFSGEKNLNTLSTYHRTIQNLKQLQSIKDNYYSTLDEAEQIYLNNLSDESTSQNIALRKKAHEEFFKKLTSLRKRSLLEPVSSREKKKYLLTKAKELTATYGELFKETPELTYLDAILKEYTQI